MPERREGQVVVVEGAGETIAERDGRRLVGLAGGRIGPETIGRADVGAIAVALGENAGERRGIAQAEVHALGGVRVDHVRRVADQDGAAGMA